jgi:hypothetical protein
VVEVNQAVSRTYRHAVLLVAYVGGCAGITIKCGVAEITASAGPTNEDRA